MYTLEIWKWCKLYLYGAVFFVFVFCFFLLITRWYHSHDLLLYARMISSGSGLLQAFRVLSFGRWHKVCCSCCSLHVRAPFLFFCSWVRYGYAKGPTTRGDVRITRSRRRIRRARVCTCVSLLRQHQKKVCSPRPWGQVSATVVCCCYRVQSGGPCWGWMAFRNSCVWTLFYGLSR